MSVTHPGTAFAPDLRRGFAERHPQLTPFLLAMAILSAAATIALSVTGLPS